MDSAARDKTFAQRFADAFWGWVALGGAVWYFANWKWALIFFVLAVLSAIESVRATLRATKLERVAPETRGATPQVNKAVLDRIYGFNRAAWERYAPTMSAPEGWQRQIKPHDTGTSVSIVDTAKGVALSIQPMYSGAEGPPNAVVWSSMYVRGNLPDVSDDKLRDIATAAEKDTGGAYAIKASYSNTGQFAGIDFLITRRPTASA